MCIILMVHDPDRLFLMTIGRVPRFPGSKIKKPNRRSLVFESRPFRLPVTNRGLSISKLCVRDLLIRTNSGFSRFDGSRLVRKIKVFRNVRFTNAPK